MTDSRRRARAAYDRRREQLLEQRRTRQQQRRRQREATHRRENSQESKEARLRRISIRVWQRLSPVLRRRIPEPVFRALLAGMRAWYRLTGLEAVGDEKFQIIATLNPRRKAGDGEWSPEDELAQLLGMPPPKRGKREEKKGEEEKEDGPPAPVAASAPRARSGGSTRPASSREQGLAAGEDSGRRETEARRGPDAAESEEVRTAIAENSGNLGAKIGQGGFGAVHEVPGRPDLVVKVPLRGGHSQLEQEARSLHLLQSKGVPTPYRGYLEWTDAQGESRQGILMDRVEGAFSKQVLQTGKFQNTVVDPAHRALFNRQTVRDLKQLKETCIEHGIKIDDLQFMVTRDGTIRVIDPARIYDLSEEKPKHRKGVMRNFSQNMDQMIRKIENMIEEP